MFAKKNKRITCIQSNHRMNLLPQRITYIATHVYRMEEANATTSNYEIKTKKQKGKNKPKEQKTT